MHANMFGDQLVPTPCKVVARRDENSDTSTLTLAAPSQWFPGFRPGQFMMVYARGVGEIPLSISGDPTHADHTVFILFGLSVPSAARCTKPPSVTS